MAALTAAFPWSAIYLDGGINMTGIRNYGNPLPNPDALQEFRVETSNFSAQYGRMSSAVVTAVTRSGTNQFHGSLFEFKRNTALNATPWNSTLNPPYHRNQFGGTVGGPVKRDKAFFFFSYGGLRQIVGQLLSGGVVPTSLERQGDFTQSEGDSGLPRHQDARWMEPIAPPTARFPPWDVSRPPCWTRRPPTSSASTFRCPNSANNAWTGFFTGPTNQDEYLGKYDQVLGAKDHLSATYFYLKTTQNAYGNGNLIWDINQSFSTQQNVNVSDIHTFSPTTVNQGWFSFTRVAGGRVNLPAGFAWRSGIELYDPGTEGPARADSIRILQRRRCVRRTGEHHGLLFAARPGQHDQGQTLAQFRRRTVAGQEHDRRQPVQLRRLHISTSAPTTTGNALADFVTGQVSTMEQDTPYHGLLSDWYYALLPAGQLSDSPQTHREPGIAVGYRCVLRSSLRTSPPPLSPTCNPRRFPSAPLGMLYPGDKGVPRGIVDYACTTSRRVSVSRGIRLATARPLSAPARASSTAASAATNGTSPPMRSPSPFARPSTRSRRSPTSTGIQPPSPMEIPSPTPILRRNPRFLPAASIETISENYQWPLVYQINAAVQQQLPRPVSASPLPMSARCRTICRS